MADKWCNSASSLGESSTTDLPFKESYFRLLWYFDPLPSAKAVSPLPHGERGNAKASKFFRVPIDLPIKMSYILECN